MRGDCGERCGSPRQAPPKGVGVGRDANYRSRAGPDNILWCVARERRRTPVNTVMSRVPGREVAEAREGPPVAESDTWRWAGGGGASEREGGGAVFTGPIAGASAGRGGGGGGAGGGGGGGGAHEEGVAVLI